MQNNSTISKYSIIFIQLQLIFSFELVEDHKLITNDRQILIRFQIPKNLANIGGVTHGIFFIKLKNI